jgi:glutathione synthase/RimK-type ligase-like ATP-grasp enzyme
MYIAIATCSDLPGWEIDDRPIFDALDRKAIEYSLVEWDDDEVDWSAFDGVLVRTTWDYTEFYREFHEWIRNVSTQTLLFNPPATLLWNSHKSYLRDLEDQGVAIAPTVWLEQSQFVDVTKIFEKTGWQEGFIKPLIGATARGTLRFRADEAGLKSAQKHLDEVLGVCGAMIQPYLSAVETEGEYSAIIIAGEVTHMVRKVPVEGDYRVQDDFGASDEPTVLEPADLEICKRICSIVSHSKEWHGDWAGEPLLYARVDLLRDREGQLVLNELELIEPSLFLRHGRVAAGRLIDALVSRIQSRTR